LDRVSIRPERSAVPPLAPRASSCWRGQGLGARRGQQHLLDPKARIDVFQLLAEELGQPLGVARRGGHADAGGLDAIVDPEEPGVQAPGAEAGRLQAAQSSPVSCVT
jgi:hypothetical protein